MLEAAVDDGPEDLGLEQEVPEAGAVDGDVGALDGVLLGTVLGARPVRPVGRRGVTGGGRIRPRGLLLLLVVQELGVGDVSHSDMGNSIHLIFAIRDTLSFFLGLSLNFLKIFPSLVSYLSLIFL